MRNADPSGRAVFRRSSVAVRLLGMQVRMSPGAWMSVVSVVRCQVEVCKKGRSLVQRDSTECATSEVDLKTSTMRTVRPNGTVES